MTAVADYLSALGLLYGGQSYDEMAAEDGTVRVGWDPLVPGLSRLGAAGLRRVRTDVSRLLENDGVTYTALSGDDEDISAPKRWPLDPVPLVIDEDQWAGLEVGLVQRAELLNALLADLYGPQKVLAEGILPPQLVFGHEGFLRSSMGVTSPDGHPLFMAAADLGRGSDGSWQVISDRTQAPSGVGYAMENRRVVSRVLPELFREADLHRIAPFFQSMRRALTDAAPITAEDPRVVIFTPGTHSETAFDQAFLASLLGFPLVEGSDLTVRDGRVWMRVLGKLEPVDVIFRRVDASWSDPLELRPNSQLGVPGLQEAVRRGTVNVVNSLGSGVLENPGLMPYLPALCNRLLEAPLALASAPTYWCGDPVARAHVLANIENLVIRPISRSTGRSVFGAELSAAELAGYRDRIEAAPHRYVGQELLPLSQAPTTNGDRLSPRSLTMRSFAVASGATYAPMLGGLARVAGPGDISGRQTGLVAHQQDGMSKDVWVLTGRAGASTSPPWLHDGPQIVAAGPSAAMVPRVLEDLFWIGRYAERAEDLIRLLIAIMNSDDLRTGRNSRGGESLSVLLQAVTHVSTSYPGFAGPAPDMLLELRSMVADRNRFGTVAHSVAALYDASQGVRDQLSNDTWMVLGGIDRALGALRADVEDQGARLADTNVQVLAGLLAIAGIASESMVRDPGWQLMDTGRGIERALQLIALLRATLMTQRSAATEAVLVDSVLSATESIITYRRRYRGRGQVGSLLELLLLDFENPRSVAYQLKRISRGLRAVPGSSGATLAERILDDLFIDVRRADSAALGHAEDGRRDELERFLGTLSLRLRNLAETVADQHFSPPVAPQPMWQPPLIEAGATA